MAFSRNQVAESPTVLHKPSLPYDKQWNDPSEIQKTGMPEKSKLNKNKTLPNTYSSLNFNL